MGPRSTDRGNNFAALPRKNVGWLQWGRDRLIAEIDRAGWACLPASRLQWRRDRLLAEIALPSSPAYCRAVLQWGRDRLIAEMGAAGGGQAEIAGLQWGRDRLIAEILFRNYTLNYVLGFNGAAID